MVQAKWSPTLKLVHNDITSSDGQFALFHPDGTIIPGCGYGFSQMKLGVGIVYEVMPFLL